ncbi:hypothetical protein GIW05_00170 [Pseudomonas syringae]|uniref:hypothetical protein n=1 Tax=Pseudomonas syringae TaxID=317 RepID=UPI001F30690F|nr:hypothetical protein [Pseudomonas syringae]MCF5381936.1 hypothetical protein [Pseudomonas syringae]MCF5423810.1 hypothetical protein [Pseudomonas syringae]MCF5455001.1 hypothetical protein [Pseudomonas syringae]MCF5459561.1 hypothetical protein [Pseudomonas syringae]
MVLTNVMPRYGTRDHQRLGMLLIALMALAVLMLIPDFAFAAFDGSFKPNTVTTSNVDNSFSAWWKVIAGWGLWLSMLGLVFCVLCLKSQGWYIPAVLIAIFMFGEMVVNAVKGVMA